MTAPLNILVVNEYTDGEGEKRNKFTQVGVAFRTKKKDTFSVVINEGIAVSGRLLLAPAKTKESSESDAKTPESAEA